MWLFGCSHKTSHGKKAPEDILKVNRSHRLQKMGNLQKPNPGSTPHWVTSSAMWDVRKASAGLAVAAEHNTAQHYLWQVHVKKALTRPLKGGTGGPQKVVARTLSHKDAFSILSRQEFLLFERKQSSSTRSKQKRRYTRHNNTSMRAQMSSLPV